jgi:Uma2 family endonuclease
MSGDLLPDLVSASPARLGRFRRRDYDALPDRPRRELLRGRLYVTPSPTVGHQTVAQLLWRHLERIAESAGGLAFLAPLDVVLADHSVVQPDVVYISASRMGIVGSWIEGAPDLLVEVLSPGTARRDRGQKLDLYAASGVREYWLVEPIARRIEFLVGSRGRFTPVPATPLYRSSEMPEVQLDLPAFWRAVESRLPPRH